MTTPYDQLPGCGIIWKKAFDSPEEWRAATEHRRELLVEATARILSAKYNDIFEVGARLNALYAPFNVYGPHGDAQNHLVVVPKSDGVSNLSGQLHFQLHNRQVNIAAPMDFCTLERFEDVWWLDDLPLPDSYEVDELHRRAAEDCLSIVWWGNKMEIQMIPIG